MLTEIIKNVPNYNHDLENILSTEQNVFIPRNTEKYYRAMIKRVCTSQNIRNEQMVSTTQRLIKFHGKDAKIIVWQYNTHIGDSRATDVASEGMVNVGYLVRKQHLREVVITVGFESYKETVLDGREWGDFM